MSEKLVFNSFDELRAYQSDRDYAPGSSIKIKIDLPWYAPVGNLADMFGTEWVVQRFTDADIIVDDVYGSTYTVTIEGTMYGTPWLLIAAVLIGLISVLGISYFIHKITVTISETPGLQITTPILAAAGLGLVGLLVFAYSKKEFNNGQKKK